MTHRATGVGSMPGESFVEAMKTVLGELADLPFLVELPERGPHAAMIGRTAAMITDIGIDLQPAGWRLTDASGLDHQRAASLLAQDLDVLEELVQVAAVGRLKVQAAGPWTMAASMERPRGDRVLGDHGARRDLAQALAEGLRVHVQEIRRRIVGADVVVQLDEPALPAVLAALIPTASGLGRHRSVTQQEAAAAIEWVASAVAGADAGAEVALHCCAADLPLGVLRETSIGALSFDLSAVLVLALRRAGRVGRLRTRAVARRRRLGRAAGRVADGDGPHHAADLVVGRPRVHRGRVDPRDDRDACVRARGREPAVGPRRP